MIKIFNASDKIYTSNGDIIIQCTKAKVHKELNGNYYLDIEAPLKYIDYLIPNNIIVANTPQGEQAFRIGNIDKSSYKIKFKAYHVFYDTKNYLLKDFRVENRDCNYALDYFNSNTDTTSPFTTLSNITTLNTLYCVRKSLYEAIQQILELWGGNLILDNWNIKIMSPTVVDNGITIRYGKNLKDITASYNWENVVTKILPVGKDGIMLNYLDETASVYIVSDTQYEIPYTKTVSFSQDDVLEENYTDADGNLDETAYYQALINDLRLQAENYLSLNCLPQVNYTLKANIEKITDVGDYIQVIDERINETFWIWVISYEYDCILEQYTQLEFGNYKKTLGGLLSNISNETNTAIQENNNNLQITLSKELQEAQDKIWNALGSSYVIYEGDKILIVDTLPKEQARNVIMINNGGIAFSNTGIYGNFTSAWTIDNVLNMEAINVINLTANLIKGGTLKLGSNLNQNGVLEVYDEANSLIATLDQTGLKMYGNDGSYILMNNEVGFVGYDKNNNPIYWVYKDEFHQKKSVIEEEITLCSKMRFIPISITGSDGIGLVSVIQNNSTAILEPIIDDEYTGSDEYYSYYDVMATNNNPDDAILYYNDGSNNATTIQAGQTLRIGNYNDTQEIEMYFKIKNKTSNKVSW